MQQIYHGMTAAELAAGLDPHATVDNLGAYQQWNADESARVRDALPCHLDLVYGEAAIQKLDIFTTGGDGGGDGGGAPVLIDIHGGGWTGGTKNARAFPAGAVSGAGIVWVPIDYGLAPDYGMDRIVDQVRRAIAWVHANIADYGGDPARIHVSGNSAGGHLTGTLLIPGWPADYGLPADVIKGALAMSGVFDLDALLLARSGPNDALGMDPAEARRNSPLHHLADQSCPLIIGYGAPELDEFKRQSRSFAEAWLGAGLEVEVIEVPGAHHFAMSR